MKTIIISIRPEWACKILNGEKTIEIRKGLALYNALKRADEMGEEVEFLMYVTKDPKHPLARFEFSNGARYEIYGKDTHYACGCSGNMSDDLNGKVVARFKAKAEKISEFIIVPPEYYEGEQGFTIYDLYDMNCDMLLKKSCLSNEQMFAYLHDGKDTNEKGTALLISDLEIFDKPKELGEFIHPLIGCSLYCDNNFIPSFCRQHCSHNKDDDKSDVWCDRVDKWWKPLDKAPRSWCYAEERK